MTLAGTDRKALPPTVPIASDPTWHHCRLVEAFARTQKEKQNKTENEKINKKISRKTNKLIAFQMSEIQYLRLQQKMTPPPHM